MMLLVANAQSARYVLLILVPKYLYVPVLTIFSRCTISAADPTSHSDQSSRSRPTFGQGCPLRHSRLMSPCRCTLQMRPDKAPLNSLPPLSTGSPISPTAYLGNFQDRQHANCWKWRNVRYDSHDDYDLYPDMQHFDPPTN